MPFAPVNGIDLYYEVHGSGPPLVLAHGSGGNHLSWWQQVPFFSRFYTCVVFDHRSFGLSKEDAEPQGRRAFAEDLRGLLDHLGLPRVAIVAHSMGGRTAVGFATRNPGRAWALVLCGSNGGSVDDESRQIMAQQQGAGQAPSRGNIRALSRAFVSRHPELAFLYLQIMRLNPRHPPDFLAPTPGHRGSTHERLAQAGVPILYIVGSDDVLAPPRTIQIAASQVPQAQLEVAQEAGHSVYFEQPEWFNHRVLRFLQEVCPPDLKTS